MMRMLNALITATCGSDVVVALGSGPFLACFGCALFNVFSLIAWVNTHFWPGEVHFNPTLGPGDLLFLLLSTMSCTVFFVRSLDHFLFSFISHT